MRAVTRKVSKLFSKTSTSHTPTDAHNIPCDNDTRIPDSILAFRTTTTMLSYIYRMKTFSETGSRSKDPELRQELKILNALASIMVRENEVVAVIAKPPDMSRITQVVACAHLTSHPQPESPQWWKFLATPNARRPDPSLAGDSLHPSDDIRDPAIVVPALGILPQFKGDKSLYEEYMGTLWGKETFGSHVWILSKLIDQSKTDAAPLQRYVVAACIYKIYHRMNNAKLSRPFTDSLLDVKAFTFPELPKVAPNAVEAGYDDPFLRQILPSLQPFLDKPTPNLLQQADAAPLEGYYTKDTCIEFHDMLCNLLICFKENLATLNSQRGTSVTPQALEPCMTTILHCGEALLYVSRGSALERHLKAIEPLLNDQRRNGVAETGAEEMAARRDKTRNEPHDPELDSVQPATIRDEDAAPLPLWRSYRDWLRLMILHFDGVAILSKHVQKLGPLHEGISIQILAPPRVSEEMLSWENLLRSPYFPDMPIPPHGEESFNPTVDEIVEFLKAWSVPSSSNTVNTLIKSLRGLLKSVHALKLNDAIERIIEQLGSLKGCELPGWANYTQEIISEIEPLKNGCGSPEMIVRDVLHKLQSLKDCSMLFRKLNQDALLNGRGFTGTLHCEFCIASFYYLLRPPMDNNYQAIVDEFAEAGSALGVSKLCCPACRYALLLLKAKIKKQFLIRGSHGTISACTLPAWLPEDIVTTMNTHFGTQLRKELQELMLSPPLTRRRIRSTGSQRLSIDSLEEKAQRPIIAPPQ